MAALLARGLDEMASVARTRRWYRYDFFEGTSRPSLAWTYVADRGTDWQSRYEASLERYLGRPAVAFGAGRMALFAVLRALGIGPGDEVIVPAFTCVVVPNAILYAGATPVYVDISAADFNIDPARIEAAITPQTRAILAQHTFGQPCAIDTIVDIARRRGLRVIEDCAHAIGGTSKGRRLGTIGDAAIVSTDHTKVISTGIGGFAVSADPRVVAALRDAQREAYPLTLSQRARVFLQYPALAWLNRPRVFWLGRPIVAAMSRTRAAYFYRDELKTSRPARWPVQLGRFQAYVGAREVAALDANISHRRRVAAAYHRILTGAVSPLPEGAWLRYSVLVDDPSAWRKALGQYFSVGRWFASIAEGRTGNWQDIRYTPGSCPTAEFAAEHIINFPTHALIDDTALARFEALVREAGLVAGILERSAR